MRHPVASVALLLMLAPAAARAQESPARGSGSACITCHANLPDHLGAPVAAWNAGDVHKDAGLGCVGCHGGDPSPALAEDLRSMAPETGFMPAPDRLQLAATCAHCHSDATYMKQFNPQARVDQFAEYLTSAHGRANQAGDPVPATCSDCHGVHGIRSVKSPASPAYASNVPATCATCHSDAAVMDPYGLPIDVHESYMDSTHADALLIRGDLAAPACNDCHGNHGAAPPGVTSVANVCGQCHGREATLFRGSFKKELFDSMEMSECIVCHGQHRILHPTPELFHGKSAPSISAGEIVSAEPFTARLARMEAGAPLTASWRVVLRPHTEADDEGLAHHVEIAAGGGEPLRLDATVRPGEASLEPRQAEAGPLSATLTIQPLSGSPVKGGDSLRLDLEVRASQGLDSLEIHDRPGARVDAVAGSTCLQCHSPGDPCDEASERMYEALTGLDRALRDSASLLQRAEHAGMEVSGPVFELRSNGTTAAIESRALIHSFDPDQLLARTGEGMEVAATALQAGEDALAELQFRRKGLAVSLILVALVLAALWLKIRQVDRARQAGAPGRP